MCGLCGLLGGTHWTEETSGAAPRRALRLRRVGFANAVLAHYGLRLHDWHGASYVLGSPTGASDIVANLVDVWRAAERLRGRACDPLDPALIERLERATGDDHG